MNEAGGDVLLVVGDTACGDGESLEQCLSKFRFAGPKLFVAGNHELWTARGDSDALFSRELPARVRAGVALAGKRSIRGWRHGDCGERGVVRLLLCAEQPRDTGTVLWSKISPGAAERFEELAHLFVPSEDIGAAAREVVARWNDGRYVRLGMSDGAFLGRRLADLDAGLTEVRGARQVIAAVHHLPFRAVLPSSHSAMGLCQGVSGE